MLAIRSYCIQPQILAFLQTLKARSQKLHDVSGVARAESEQPERFGPRRALHYTEVTVFPQSLELLQQPWNVVADLRRNRILQSRLVMMLYDGITSFRAAGKI